MMTLFPFYIITIMSKVVEWENNVFSDNLLVRNGKRFLHEGPANRNLPLALHTSYVLTTTEFYLCGLDSMEYLHSIQGDDQLFRRNSIMYIGALSTVWTANGGRWLVSKVSIIYKCHLQQTRIREEKTVIGVLFYWWENLYWKSCVLLSLGLNSLTPVC